MNTYACGKRNISISYRSESSFEEPCIEKWNTHFIFDVIYQHISAVIALTLASLYR